MSGVGGAPVGAWVNERGFGTDLFDEYGNLVGWVWIDEWHAWPGDDVREPFAGGHCSDAEAGMRACEAALHAAGVAYCTLGPAGLGVAESAQ